jgi:hypothetical protein
MAQYDLLRDAYELKPRVLKKGSAPYESQTRRLAAWFERTETKGRQEELSTRDVEVLKSLGYIQ